MNNKEKTTMNDWWIFKGDGQPHDDIEQRLPAPPPWRKFTDEARRERGAKFIISDKQKQEILNLVNAALYLRRPLLVTGQPGTGKSTLAYAVAHELNLGQVLLWPITTRSTLQQGLYRYDAIARLQDASLQRSDAVKDQGAVAPSQDIGRYIRLGPLGTALLPSPRPRVLLIDEIDKSDIDLPNNLLNIFEEGEFEIPELARLPEEFKSVEILLYDSNESAIIERGRVRCTEFPFVVLTSNGEREFPPAFLRRCLQLQLDQPKKKDILAKIVAAHLDLDPSTEKGVEGMIQNFLDRRDDQGDRLATDQLLNAVYLVTKSIDPLNRNQETLINALWKSLTSTFS